MHILKDPFRIISRTDAEQGFHFIIPESRKLIGGNLIPEDRFFHFVPEDDMQAVGYLIGLGADIAGMYVVNGPAEGIKGNFLKLRQKSAQFSVNRNPEGRPASQDVFIKTGLAFMQAHQVYRLCCGIRERGINVLLKDSVSAFMDGTEDGGYGVRLMIMIRHPDISAAQGCGEWMRTLCRSSGIEVKPDIRKKQILHLFLGIDVVCPFQGG